MNVLSVISVFGRPNITATLNSFVASAARTEAMSATPLNLRIVVDRTAANLLLSLRPEPCTIVDNRIISIGNYPVDYCDERNHSIFLVLPESVEHQND